MLFDIFLKNKSPIQKRTGLLDYSFCFPFQGLGFVYFTIDMKVASVKYLANSISEAAL